MSKERQSAATNILLKVYALTLSLVLVCVSLLYYDIYDRIDSLHHALLMQRAEGGRSKRFLSDDFEPSSTFAPVQTIPPLDDSIWSSQSDSQRPELANDRVNPSFGSDIFNKQIPGTTYVRWGRSTCPNQSSHVYGGYIAGPKLTRSRHGSGSTFHCIPKDPYITRPSSSLDARDNSNYTILAAAKYNTIDRLANRQIDCSVCLVQRKAQIMIPNGALCPQFWIREYGGTLMTATGDRRNRMAVEHICMDDGATGGDNHQNGATVDLVEVQTGECSGANCRSLTGRVGVGCIVCSTE